MKKIMWCSAHTPLEAEIQELKRTYGQGTRVEHIKGHHKKGYMSADAIVETFRKGGYDELFMIAPLTVVAAVLDRGIKPIRAEVTEVQKEEAHDFEYRGRFFCFGTPMFVRVIEIRIVTEEI